MASRPARAPRGSRRAAPARAARRRRGLLRALLLLIAAALVGIGAAVALRGDDGPPPPEAAELRPGAAVGQGQDPLRYDADRAAAFTRRAALGLAHPLYAFSPGGAVATAARVQALRPEIEAAAGGGKVVDADTLEGMVLLESAGRPDAMASNDLDGAVGLTQILAETGQNLLKMQVDVARSTRITKLLRRATGDRAMKLAAERRRVDERFDPVKSLQATVRYLRFARSELDDRLDLAVASYHMGVGNLQNVIADYDEGDDVPYAELFFGSTPIDHTDAHDRLTGFGDDSSTYLWRVDAAKAIMRASRQDQQSLQRTAQLQTNKNSAEEVLHSQDDTSEFTTAGEIKRATGRGTLRPLDPARLATWGLAIDPSLGELAPRLEEPKSRYRALRPEAITLLQYLGTGVQELSGSKEPLRLTSAVRDDAYQRLLTARNIEATRNFSLHTTGFAFDVLRSYATKKQALAFQFLLDRLTALNLIAWVREPAAIHITVAGDAARVLANGI